MVISSIKNGIRNRITIMKNLFQETSPQPFIQINRREFLNISLLTSLGYAICACSNTAGSNTQKPNAAQIVYQDWRTDWFTPMAQEMLKLFHTTHPNIHVFYTIDPPSDEYEQKMIEDFQSGTAPDVFQGCCAHFPAWAQKGYTLDLRSYVESLDQAIIKDWDPAQYDALFRRDGLQFGLPKYHGALALYYNKDLFDKYNVEYPNKNWDHKTYLKAMRQLTQDRNNDGKIDLWGSMFDVSWDRIQVHVNDWGGHFVDPTDPTRSLMGESAAIGAMEWLRARMWDDHVMANSIDLQNISLQDAFINEKVAMIEDGSWSLKKILSEAKFRIGVAPLPAGPARKVTLTTTDGFGIFSKTKYPDAAWELIKFLVSKEYGKAMAKVHLLQPARASLINEWIDYARQEFPQQTVEMDFGSFTASQIQGHSVVSEIFRNQYQASQLANKAWSKIYSLGTAPVSSMIEVSHQIDLAQKMKLD